MAANSVSSQCDGKWSIARKPKKPSQNFFNGRKPLKNVTLQILNFIPSKFIII